MSYRQLQPGEPMYESKGRHKNESYKYCVVTYTQDMEHVAHAFRTRAEAVEFHRAVESEYDKNIWRSLGVMRLWAETKSQQRPLNKGEINGT
jgi:hypothetical protein